MKKYCLTSVMTTLLLMCGVVCSAQTTDSLCAPHQLPWSTSFEDAYGVPQCWTAVSTYGTYPEVYQYGYASTGSHSMAMTGSDSYVCMLATPLMAHRADSLHVGFVLTMTAGDGTLQVGLMSDTSDATSFTAFLTLNLASCALGYYEFYTDGFAASDTQAVAFRVVDGRVAFDDVEVEAATLCRRPCQGVISNVAVSTATVSWTSCGGNASQYLVRLTNTASGAVQYTASTATTLQLTGLLPGTAYQVDVAALCGTDTTGWLHVGTMVTEVTCRNVTGLYLDDLTANTAVLRWNYDTTGVNMPTGAALHVYDVTAAATHLAAVTPNDYSFVGNLTAGHRYRAVVRTICTADTADEAELYFTPVGDACSSTPTGGASSLVPLNAGYGYSYAQMLYPSSLAAGLSSLYGIALRVASGSVVAPRHIDVYIGQTNDTTLTANISTSLAHKVIESMAIMPSSTGWLVLPFYTPLSIDSTRNLVVTVVDNTGLPGGSLLFGTHYDPRSATLYASNSTQPYDPTAFGMTLNSMASVADLQLFGNCAGAACQPPAASVVESTTSTLAIGVAGGSATQVVRYRPEGAAQWQTAAVSGFPHIIGGLNAATLYQLQAGSVCGTDTVYGRIILAGTACGVVSAPYFVDFTAGENICWQGVQRITSDGLMIAGDNVVSPTFNVSASLLQVRVMVRGDGSGNSMLRVGACNADAGGIVWADSIAAGLQWEERVAYLDGYTGAGHNIVIGGYGCVVATVSVEPLADCLPPRGIAIGSIGGDRATFTWNGNASGYELHLREADGSEWASWQTAANSLTVTGLEQNTAYVGYMLSLCSGGASASEPVPVSFVTTCGTISYFPYVQDFESTDELQCWTLDYADPQCAARNPMQLTLGHAYSGQRSLRLSSYANVPSGNYEQYVVSPRISATDSIVLSFYHTKENYASEPFAVGFSTSGNSIESFLWFAAVEPVVGQWSRYEVALPRSTRYVAIKYMGQENYYLYIDHLTIEGNGCAAPVITALDEQSDRITIEWEGDGDSAVVAITDGMWLSSVEGVTVAGNSYSFEGLQTGRYYTVGVRNHCPDGHLSDWTTQRVATINTGCVPPTALAASGVGLTTATLEWTPAGTGQQWQLCLMSQGDIVWLGNTLAAPHCDVTGLEPGTDYDIIVRSLCGGIPGLWSDTLSLTTLECMPVTDLTYERIDFRTIELSWQAPSLATGRYLIEYGPEGFTRGTGNMLTANENPYRIQHMEPYTNYDIYMQNYCEADVLSDSATYLYVPNGVGIDAVEGDRIDIYPNPASNVVTISGLTPGAEVTFVDITGRTVIQLLNPWCAVGSADNSALRVPVSRLSPGTWFVRVADSRGVTVNKLIVR